MSRSAQLEVALGSAVVGVLCVLYHADHIVALNDLLSLLHYAYPIVVFIYYLVSSAIVICTLQTASPQDRLIHQRLITALLAFAILTYTAESLIVTVPHLLKYKPPEQETIIGLLYCTLVFSTELARLSGTENPVWFPYIGSCLIALVFEPVILVLGLKLHAVTYTQISTIALRSLLLALVLGLYFYGRRDNSFGMQAVSDDSRDSSKFSSDDNTELPGERRIREHRERMARRLKEDGNWFTHLKRFAIFWPYIWPDDRYLQVRAVLVGVLVAGRSVLDISIHQRKSILIDSLISTSDRSSLVQVLILAGLELLSSDIGIPLLQKWLSLPLEQYSYRAIVKSAYSHILGLSSDFHDSNNSSDTSTKIQSTRSISRSVGHYLSAIPTLLDISVALVHLTVTFGPYEAFIATTTLIIFAHLATRTGPVAAYRRKVQAYYEESHIRQAGIQNWRTATYFNQIDNEVERYNSAVDSYASHCERVAFKYTLHHAPRGLVLLVGRLLSQLLAAYQINIGKATLGDFSMLSTYWLQLGSSATVLAELGSSLSANMIELEGLLDVLHRKPTVANEKNAKPLNVGARIEFKGVSFSYDSSRILRDISFYIPGGHTAAFVGPTGAGKSTIFHLISRLYNASDGSIFIDGQNIQAVTIKSLHDCVGVVPQSFAPSHGTIMHNIRYAKSDASDDEVIEACMAASIHDSISTFPDGYNTMVGQGGRTLSGGELQRLALAMVILKGSPILLLDEATSSLDANTADKIQEALKRHYRRRTTLVVTHRLSTIRDVDIIFVVDGGKIIQTGTHEKLLGENGMYAELWSKQISA